MKVIGPLFISFISLTAFSQDGFKVTVKNQNGATVIKEVLESQKDWLTVTYGSSEKGEVCNSYILVGSENNYMEVVITDGQQHPVARFYVTEKNIYRLLRKETDGSDGEDVGFHTYDSYKVGNNYLHFKKAGDSYYDVAIEIHGQRYSCNVDF